jgi:hypothetical protein
VKEPAVEGGGPAGVVVGSSPRPWRPNLLRELFSGVEGAGLLENENLLGMFVAHVVVPSLAGEVF